MLDIAAKHHVSGTIKTEHPRLFQVTARGPATATDNDWFERTCRNNCYLHIVPAPKSKSDYTTYLIELCYSYIKINSCIVVTDYK
jgi:hypothetical protein